VLPIGHIAYTWAALAWLQSRGRAAGIDYRGAALAALLPDLIDKPLSLTLLSGSGTSQGPAHTLLGQLLLSLAVVRFKPAWRPYALLCNGHLLADQMWNYPRTLLFPLLGRFDYWKFMGTPQTMLHAYAEIATRPAIMAVELLGLALLGWALHHSRLGGRGAWKALLLTGNPAAGKERGHSGCG